MKVYVVTEYDMITESDVVISIYKNKNTAEIHKKKFEDLVTTEDDYYEYFIHEYDLIEDE